MTKNSPIKTYYSYKRDVQKTCAIEHSQCNQISKITNEGSRFIKKCVSQHVQVNMSAVMVNSNSKKEFSEREIINQLQEKLRRNL